ncbi:MAG: hypothetical protein ACYTGH_04040 [Planctomycetota bacterium]|jgi:hypothetical protein
MLLCRHYQKTLDRHLDEETPIPSALSKHLKACATCQRYHDDQRRLIDRLRAERQEPTLTKQEFTHILNAIQADRSRPHTQPPALLRILVPVAAAACLMLTLALWESPDSTRHTTIPSPHRPIGLRHNHDDENASSRALALELSNITDTAFSLLPTSSESPPPSTWQTELDLVLVKGVRSLTLGEQEPTHLLAGLIPPVLSDN